MVKWYSFLNNKDQKDCLSRNEKIKHGNIVICRQTTRKEFAVFDDLLNFFSFSENTPAYLRCFFECLFPDSSRKPYFDVDIPIESEDLYSQSVELINEIKDKIREKVKNVVIAVYSSHTDKKYSYHVVIVSHFLENFENCKGFCLSIIELLTHPLKKHVDLQVYKSVQQFRVLNSHKFERDNTKKLCDLSDTIAIPDSFLERSSLYHFRVSLLTVVQDCEIIEGYQVKIQKKNLSSGNCTDEDIHKVINIVGKIYPGIEYNKSNIQDGNLLVTFKNKGGYYCELCLKTHEHENPFVIIKGKFRDILFSCRRDEKYQKIGELGMDIGSCLLFNNIVKVVNFCSSISFPLKWNSKFQGIVDVRYIKKHIKNIIVFENDEKAIIKNLNSTFPLVSDMLKYLFNLARAERCSIKISGKFYYLSNYFKYKPLDDFDDDEIKNEVRKNLVFGLLIGIYSNKSENLYVRQFDNKYKQVVYFNDKTYDIDVTKNHINTNDIKRWFTNEHQCNLYIKDFVRELGKDIRLQLLSVIQDIDPSLIFIVNHFTTMVLNFS